MKSKSQKKKCTNCGYTNHTEPKCYRPGGPLHKTKQKEQKKKKEKAHAAEANSSTSKTDSSSHDTAAIFQQWTGRTFNNSDYLMVVQVELLKPARHHLHSMSVEGC